MSEPFSKRKLLKEVLSDRGRNQGNWYFGHYFTLGKSTLSRRIRNRLGRLRHAIKRLQLTFKAVICILADRIEEYDFDKKCYHDYFEVALFDPVQIGGYFDPPDYDCCAVLVSMDEWYVMVYRAW